MTHTQQEMARRQIEAARQYTLTLLDGLDDDDWFRQPVAVASQLGVTHLAWQVAHLAMAEYGLTLFRQRGRQPEDGELMSSKFRKQFSKGSTPDPDPANNPPPAEIRAVFDRIHAQALREIATYSDDELAAPVDAPYAAYGTRLGALLFCAHHEMLHAGQIGLIRRLLGKSPVR